MSDRDRYRDRRMALDRNRGAGGSPARRGRIDPTGATTNVRNPGRDGAARVPTIRRETN
jgi:hypothetical protein